MLRPLLQKVAVLLLGLVAIGAALAAAPATNLVMKSVFRISGNTSKGEPVMGTGFLVQRNSNDKRQAWLITAYHVLTMISGEKASLLIRMNSSGVYVGVADSIRIRLNANNLYHIDGKHDLAALPVELPANSDYNLLSTEMLATEKDFTRLNVGVGSRLLVYGFPYGESFQETGYCIVRNGIVSSFPLFPVSPYSSFLADFEVFEGYSGAPVIIESDRGLMLLGMALEEVFLEELRPGKSKTLRKRHGLGLAKVLNSAVIRDFVEGLR